MTSNFENQLKKTNRIKERLQTAQTLLEFMQNQQPQTDEIQTLAQRLKAQIRNDEIALVVAMSTP